MNPLKQIERRERFEEWKQHAKQNRIVKALVATIPPYGASPQQILDREVYRKEVSKLMELVQKETGDDTYYLLYRRFVLHENLQAIADDLQVNRSTILRRIRKGQEICLRVGQDKYDDVLDLFTSKDQLPSHSGSSIPAFPFEFMMNKPSTPYKYRGQTRYHTKCRIPEYLQDSFKSTCKCSLCFNDYGCNTCKRRKDN